MEIKVDSVDSIIKADLVDKDSAAKVDLTIKGDSMEALMVDSIIKGASITKEDSMEVLMVDLTIKEASITKSDLTKADIIKEDLIITKADNLDTITLQQIIKFFKFNMIFKPRIKIKISNNKSIILKSNKQHLFIPHLTNLELITM